MTDNKQDIDSLTRSLLEGTAERPSASLNLRIMELVRKERRIQKAKVPSDGIRGLVIGFAIYFLVVAALFGLGYAQDITTLAALFETYPRLQPCLLTVGSSAMLFFFFTQLNNYLLWKKNRRNR